MLQLSEFDYLKNEILCGTESRIIQALSRGRASGLPIDAFYTDMLSVCNFLETHKNTLCSLPQLRELLNSEGLNLSALGLNHLPKYFEVLADLTDKVDLSRNAFSDFPAVLFKFSNLKSLDLSGNLLRNLPENFNNFKILEKLNLQNNPFVRIPNHIAEIDSLKTIMLSCSNEMYFSGKFPKNLESLNIDFLRTFPFPELIFNIKTLKSLNLKGIAVLPEKLSVLENLEELYIERSGIEDLPETLSQINNLKKISLINLPLMNRLPDVIFSLENLEILDLRECPLQDLPARLRKMKNLKKINLSGCADEKTLEFWTKRCESWGMDPKA